MERRLSYLSLKNMILISNWCRKLIKLKQSGPLSEASLKIKGGVSEAAVSEAAVSEAAVSEAAVSEAAVSEASLKIKGGDTRSNIGEPWFPYYH